MHTTEEYIAELEREVQMREKVYPGRVTQGKLTQAAADRKVELIESLIRVFRAAADLDCHPQDLSLPISMPPAQLTSLEPHLREVEQEIKWREHILLRSNYGRATRQIKLDQLQILREILEHLRAIQNRHQARQTQTTLF